MSDAADLRDQIAEALGAAAHRCGPRCWTDHGCPGDPAITADPGLDGRVVSVAGAPEAIADALMPFIAAPATAYRDEAIEQRQRAEQAEATIERVRALAEDLSTLAPADDWGDSLAGTVTADVARQFLATLDQPKEPT